LGQVAHDIGNTVTDVAYPLAIKLPEKKRSKSKHKPKTRVKKLPHKKGLKLERKLYNMNRGKGEKW
jgi:hypothetical protein